MFILLMGYYIKIKKLIIKNFYLETRKYNIIMSASIIKQYIKNNYKAKSLNTGNYK